MGASKVVSIDLIEDHYCVTEIPAIEVDPDVFWIIDQPWHSLTGYATYWPAVGTETCYMLGITGRGAYQATIWIMPC